MIHDKIYNTAGLAISNMEIGDSFRQALTIFYKGGPPAAFYFDDTIKDNMDLYETALDFSKNGFLKIPFDSCIFYAKEFCQNKADMCLVLMRGNAKTEIVLWPTIIQNNHKQVAFTPCVVNIDMSAPEKASIGILDSEDLTQDITDLAHWGTYVALVGMMMINHPAYEQNEVTPSAALNKARAKKGKPALSKYIYINMKPHIKAALSAGTGTVITPHWRRGHIRRLHDGRVVPVQACLVNWDGDPDEIRKKIYVA